ncbi:hypothetical protein DB30_05460 [Enhygromyxa salina]|uniref:Hemerythrin-like domain-containing protein n=1 Tax=Enhygromyxa salina TaxID=215803 RepID=A0A0C2CX31_9BACT|nr:DUF3565 domain-containing protein [Enhygromyxa salina]KIG15586.1 hypothetical protein DB30_05460 [Enhygromyxa salina]
MNRHESLRGLSRDHHHALVLARTLLRVKADPPADPARFIAEIRTQWFAEVSPHFSVEERELLPLSDCASQELREHAQRIRSEHAQLRGLLEGLGTDDLADHSAQLGELLEAHVRFEERTWFPTLEAALDPPTLAGLSRRLQLIPESLITGFHRDEDGVWVAELDCTHTQHVRHAPPFSLAPWVTEAAGRAAHVGTPLRCQLCRMPRLPPCATSYRQSPEYDETTIPAGLLRSHHLRAGAWGQIQVLEGSVQYVLEDEGDLTLVLRPGVMGIVAPARPHHIALGPGARVCIHFCRCAALE